MFMASRWQKKSQRFNQLLGTRAAVWTAQRHLAFALHQGVAAGRTHRRGLNGTQLCLSTLPARQQHRYDLRDDLARFFHQHVVAKLQAQALHLLPVVQRGARHRGTGQLDGL